MRFMVSFTQLSGVTDGLSPEERGRRAARLGALMGALKAKGSELVFLSPAEEAVTLRQHDDGRVAAADGPLKPGPEQLGGYFVIEVEALEEAVEWARRSRFITGANEVRQILDDGQ